MSLSEALVSISNLETTFFTKAGAIRAVDDVSYTINRGQTLGIVGESGCGKSVTSFSIMGLLDEPGKVTGGTVEIDGTNILNLSEREMEEVRGNRVAMIFQEPMTAFNPVLTIGYQMDEQILRHMKVSRKESKDYAIEMLRMTGIPAPEQRYHNYAHQLSGGMRQRAMIAMALSCSPDFLIADEPTTALDVTIQAQILELIQDLQKKLNMAVQFITHDLGVISELADRVLVMYAGRTCEIADSEDIFRQPRHPYTEALIRSIPKIDETLDRLPAIAGSVPSPLDLPKGCHFQNRCTYVSEECRMSKPRMKEVAPNHRVACFHPCG
jgi:peptide/nickel transport system ATP-binding protein